jgi:hypothetical protein
MFIHVLVVASCQPSASAVFEALTARFSAKKTLCVAVHQLSRWTTRRSLTDSHPSCR